MVMPLCSLPLLLSKAAPDSGALALCVRTASLRTLSLSCSNLAIRFSSSASMPRSDFHLLGAGSLRTGCLACLRFIRMTFPCTSSSSTSASSASSASSAACAIPSVDKESFCRRMFAACAAWLARCGAVCGRSHL